MFVYKSTKNTSSLYFKESKGYYFVAIEQSDIDNENEFSDSQKGMCISFLNNENINKCTICRVEKLFSQLFKSNSDKFELTKNDHLIKFPILLGNYICFIAVKMDYKAYEKAIKALNEKDDFKLSDEFRTAFDVRNLVDELNDYVNNKDTSLFISVNDDNKDYNEEKVTRTKDKDYPNRKTLKPLIIKKPSEIKQYLDKSVIAQENAKISLSVAVYNHYKRILQPIKEQKNTKYHDVEIKKSNILLLGPTGSGKTELARSIATVLDVPFVIASATSITATGYVGSDITNVLYNLYKSANYDINRAEKGIVFLDEFDKLAKKNSNTRDITGGSVQEELLKIIEGDVITVSDNHRDPSFSIDINTKNILFICAGAFSDMLDKISNPIEVKHIGFGSVDKKSVKAPDYSGISSQDIIEYGIIPELMGRLPIITYTEELSKDNLIKILSEPKNAIIKQYQKIMYKDHIELEFEYNALDYIADEALKRGTGARGLRSIIEKSMTKTMFIAPDEVNLKKIIITKNSVENTNNLPKFIYKKTPKQKTVS